MVPTKRTHKAPSPNALRLPAGAAHTHIAHVISVRGTREQASLGYVRASLVPSDAAPAQSNGAKSGVLRHIAKPPASRARTAACALLPVNSTLQPTPVLRAPSPRLRSGRVRRRAEHPLEPLDVRVARAGLGLVRRVWLLEQSAAAASSRRRGRGRRRRVVRRPRRAVAFAVASRLCRVEAGAERGEHVFIGDDALVDVGVLLGLRLESLGLILDPLLLLVVLLLRASDAPINQAATHRNRRERRLPGGRLLGRGWHWWRSRCAGHGLGRARRAHEQARRADEDSVAHALQGTSDLSTLGHALGREHRRRAVRDSSHTCAHRQRRPGQQAVRRNAEQQQGDALDRHWRAWPD
mmetsp:Transcript_31559/g.54023  ORF Transcript_31559/g.54023 Transcript_31559/m.54023 type:complete len:352 (+) Transcript_31559:194-1249(+)